MVTNMSELNFDTMVAHMKDIGYQFPERVFLSIPNAEEHLRQGLRKFAGENYKWLSAYNDITEWLTDNKGRGLLLLGNCGLGKTLIGGKIIPILVNYFHKLVITPYSAQEMNERVDEVLHRHLVFLDDIGTENMRNDYGNRRVSFAEIVDEAERKGNLLIITSNLPVSQLRQKYGERVVDRLKALTKVVLFEGESMRK